MNQKTLLQIAIVSLLAAPLGAVAQTNFFSDNFSNGSTINAASPAKPTANSTSYIEASSKGWSPKPAIASGDLKFGIASTGGGISEIEALFATNVVAMTQIGDYVQLTVTFTDTSGILTGTGFLDFGLYNSGQVMPFSGGMNGNLTTASNYVGAGYAQGWSGYVGEISYTGGKNQIRTRAAQTGADNRNQDLTSSGSSSTSYATPPPSTVGSTATSTTTLTAGSTYTEVLIFEMNGASSLAITNTLYSGANTNGTVLATFGGVATNSTFLTSGFDSLAIGFYQKTSGPSNVLDIASITVSGSVTGSVPPPTITTEPVNVTVPSGGSCAFSVAANGFNLTYLWHRNGTNLLDGGNISGATTSQLVISPASGSDVSSTYYVTVTGTGDLSTNSTTASLSLGSATTLVWSGSATDWDIETTPAWQDTNGNPGLDFNYGDAVIFNDVGGGGTVRLDDPYMSASSVTVDSSIFYTWQGSGSFAGPGGLSYIGSAQFTITNNNTYTGGTLISNATANLRLGVLTGLGTGSVTLGLAGGQMELLAKGNSVTGIPNNFVLADDFTFTVDPVDDSYSAVFYGDFSGTSGKTLTVNHGANGAGTNQTRIRAYGTNTVFNANLLLNDSTFLWAFYPAAGSQTYNGTISGPGALMQKSATTYLNGANTYSGGTTPAGGSLGLGIDSVGNPVTSGPIGTGPLLLAVDSTTSLDGSGTIFAASGARTIANPIQYLSASNNLTLDIGGSNDLTLAGPFTLQGNDGSGTGTNRTIQVDNTALSTITGVIDDGGFHMGLIKTGSGALYLNAANTYAGGTTNNSRSTNALGLLAGSGSIAGSAYIQTNSAIGGGSGTSIGTFTINGNLSVNGNVFVRVDKSLSPSLDNDTISVGGTLSNIGTGTVIVSNLGPALTFGDSFTIFNKAMTGATNLAIKGGGNNLIWSNRLAIDGSIVLAGTVSTNSPTLGAVLSGNNLQFSWPADHLGWILQTNSVGLNSPTNWFAYPNSSNVTSLSLPVNRAKTNVFFRLVYP